MNRFNALILSGLRKLYDLIFTGWHTPVVNRGIEDANLASDLIYSILETGKPCMIARFGSTELACVRNYIGVMNPNKSVYNYIKGTCLQWWWNEKLIKQIEEWSGFFPSNKDTLSQFAKLMLDDCKYLDLLGSWVDDEYYVQEYITHAKKVSLLYLEPYWSNRPWSRILKGKNVVVVHPFAELIEQQYKTNRHFLFRNSDVLPEFNLRTVKAVQSLGGQDHGFSNWFEALDWMKHEIDKEDYDICLIGCGAYGFPLAAHVKRTGKQAVHIGGALQILFGIIGKRWEDPQYGFREFKKESSYKALFNHYWKRPGKETFSVNHNKVENSCYW